LSSTSGACPYCGQRILVDPELDNPYAPPKSSLDGQFNALAVPGDLGGKLAMAFRLLFGQLPLFASLVLTIWVPGHFLTALIEANNPTAGNPLEMLWLSYLIAILFGPIYAGGIITALAARMSGERMTYVE